MIYLLFSLLFVPPPAPGHLDIVKYLVAHNAEINLANAYNNTCLMISAYKGHTDVVEFLLNNGADPDQQALCGATALHYAAECGHVDICAALLDYGATLKRNEFDMTAVTTAAERTRELVVELFYGRPNLLTKEEVKTKGTDKSQSNANSLCCSIEINEIHSLFLFLYMIIIFVHTHTHRK